jgi:hypothetical protein
MYGNYQTGAIRSFTADTDALWKLILPTSTQ